MRARPRLCFVLAVLVAAWLPLTETARAGQFNTGEISGVVRDAQGGVLKGATVAAVNQSTGFREERVTDGQGRYRLAALPVGRYTVTIVRDGFARAEPEDVVIALGQQLRLDVTLHVAAVAEQMSVTAHLPLLQATNAEISDVIDERRVAQIPLNSRTFLALAQLSDGVVLPPGGTRGDAQQAGPLPNVGGQRSGHNIYLLDGVKVTDELFNNLVINPSVDAIQEFKIQKSQYAAEFGGKASALINVATKSGNNRWQGSAFEFLRDDAFDSRGYFDPPDRPKPPLRQHQFGATTGGPIARDRTFWFGSYEGQRVQRGETKTFSVPSEAARRGDLGGVRIDPSRIDPMSSALLPFIPLPNRPGESQNLVAVEDQIKDADQFSVRIDQRLATSDLLFARFSSFDATEQQPFGTSALQETLLPGFGRQVDTHARNLGVSYTRVVSQSAMNEMRIGWLSVRGGQRNANQGYDFAAMNGLQGVTRDPRDAGFPQVSTRGLYNTFGDPASTIVRDNTHFELYDSVLLDKGLHRVKFGGYLFHLRFRPEQPDNARGVFTYSGQFSGSPFGDFLLGYPSSALSGVGRGAEDGRTTWVHAFAQDDWRIRDNLTLNVGLRYEFNQHMYDSANRLSSVDLSGSPRFVIASEDDGSINAAATPLLPLIPIPYVTTAEAGWNNGLLDPSHVRLAPRTGFAWSLGDDRVVVRGGYGVFLNQWAYSVQTALARNLPFFYTRQIDVPLADTTPRFHTSDILTADPTGTVSPSIMDHDFAVEYTQTWSGGVQYEWLPSLMAEVGYMGSWTLGADNSTIRNVPEPAAGAVQPRRPIPQLGPIRAIRFDGKSIYHGITVKTEQRLRHGYAFSLAYTLSTSRDDASSPGATESEANVPQNVRNVFDETGEWAHSSFDHRHLFTASATYQVPVVSGGPVRALLSDWRFNGVFLAQSGAPFTVSLGVDQANIGAGPAQRPDQFRDPNLPASDRRADRWFDTAAFALPAPYTFGSAPRNSVIGPGFASLDLSIARSFLLRSSRLEVRWDIFNSLNKANFDVPNRVFGTPNFGRIFSAKHAREMQLGVKLIF